MDSLRKCAILFLIAHVFSHRSYAVAKKNYTGYQVFKVSWTGESDLDSLDSLFEHLRADVWKRPSRHSHHYDVMVAGSAIDAFRTTLRARNMSYSPWIDDVQQLIDDVDVRRPRRHKRQYRKFHYDVYHNHREIMRWMRRFSRSNSDLVSVFQVGTTYEGRKIMGLKIGVYTATEKRVLWQDSLIHAREWITGATLLWVANKLVRGYRRNDPEIVGMLTNLDFVMVPVWNVDGYKHTWTTDRLWRKSRSIEGSLDCVGVDLNRNFYTPRRGGGAASDYICSGVYQGTSAFSEPETATVAAFLGTLTIASFVSIHSFSQFWLYPFGYTSERSLDHSELKNISIEAVSAMQKVHETTYVQGAVSEVVYKVSGGSIDWAHSTLCVKYAFGIELRDRGKFGFLLPEKFIVPTAEEYFAGLKVLANHVIQSNSTRSSMCDVMPSVQSTL